MNSFKKLMIALVLIISVIGIVGCEEKGEVEKAGEKPDKAIEDTSKKAMDKPMEDTSKLDKPTEDTSKKASDSLEDTSKLDKAMEDISKKASDLSGK